jgi:hypothetical protein
MARYNEILVGRWNRFLQKLLSMKGGPPAPQLASEITAVFELEQPPVEDRFLLGWNRFGFGLQFNGAVGNPSQIRLRNPTGSGVIAVIESIFMFQSPNDRIQLTYTATAADLGLQTVVPLDGRSGTTSSSVRVSNSNAAATAGLAVYQDFALTFSNANPVEAIYNRNQEIVIAPGFAWGAQTISANVALTVNVIWRERIIEEGELK